MNRFVIEGIALMVVAIVSAGPALAQIEITSDDIMQDVGTVMTYEGNDTTSIAVNLGSPGGPREWDFTSQITPHTWETTVVEKSMTPFADDFPSANFVTESGEGGWGTSWTYAQISQTFHQTQGVGIQTPDTSYVTKYNPPLTQTLPMTFGSTGHLDWGYADTVMVGPPMVIVSWNHSSSYTIDAWGTVQIPLGTYQTLRIASWDTTIYMYTMGSIPITNDTSTSINYAWVSKNSGHVAYIGSHDGETDPNFTDAATFGRLKSCTGVDQGEPMAAHPLDYGLGKNYPNPFNASTEIPYHLPHAGEVALEIFNVMGERVATLANETQASGRHVVHWHVGELPSGVYLCRLRAKDLNMTKRLVLIR